MSDYELYAGRHSFPRVALWANMSHCVAVKNTGKNLCPRALVHDFVNMYTYPVRSVEVRRTLKVRRTFEQIY